MADAAAVAALRQFPPPPQPAPAQQTPSIDGRRPHRLARSPPRTRTRRHCCLAITASVEDLLHHRVYQSIDELRRSLSTIPRRDHDVIWLVERFTETYVDRWAALSWRQEWRYINMERKGCCHPGVMHEREIDQKELAVYLAEVGCRHIDSHDEESADRRIKISELTPIALQAIRITHLVALRLMQGFAVGGEWGRCDRVCRRLFARSSQGTCRQHRAAGLAGRIANGSHGGSRIPF